MGDLLILLAIFLAVSTFDEMFSDREVLIMILCFPILLGVGHVVSSLSWPVLLFLIFGVLV